MAGSLDSPSRLRLQLQDYDQVIALSQANINESLEVHFLRNKKLQDFESMFPSYGIKGKLGPPTVHLIDKENADQALFYINFKSGTYYYFDHSSDAPKYDEDGFPLPAGPPQRIKVKVDGWSLAFFVDFSFKKMSTIPEKIRKAIELPGSYSVNQLLIDFGTPDILNIAWAHCKTPGVLDDKEAKSRADIRIFLANHLESVLLKEENHNILGYAVKIEPPSDSKTKQERLMEVTNDAPSFPPTSVRLQTISYRPGGVEVEVGSEKSDHNAFLFTEMTQFREMPAKDLRWSGDWFYDGIGGTMAMSRRIFLDQYLIPKLKPAVIVPWELANFIGGLCSYFPDSSLGWVLSMPRLTSVEMKSDTGLRMVYSGSDENEMHVKGGEQKLDDYWAIKANVKCVIEPRAGKGTIAISSRLETEAHRKVDSTVGNLEFKIRCHVQWHSDIHLRAVETGAKLLVDVYAKTPEVSIEILQDKFTTKGEGPDVDAWVKRMRKFVRDGKEHPVEEGAKWAIRYHSLVEEGLMRDLETSLNSQGRFIFPGGGTFEMKDPVFSEVGDLLIGLTFREGAE